MATPKVSWRSLKIFAEKEVKPLKAAFLTESKPQIRSVGYNLGQRMAPRA